MRWTLIEVMPRAEYERLRDHLAAYSQQAIDAEAEVERLRGRERFYRAAADGDAQTVEDLRIKVERLREALTGRQAKIVADQRAENERLREDYAKLRDALEHVSESEDRLRAEVKRLRVFEAAFAKVPQEQQARIMAAVRAEMGKRHLPT